MNNIINIRTSAKNSREALAVPLQKPLTINLVL
jgi:hypothetical protein